MPIAGSKEEIRREKQSSGRAVRARSSPARCIVAGTNVWLVRSLRAPARPRRDAGPHRPPAGGRSIAMMPKAKGDPYFVSCRAGAEEAARGARRRADLGRPDRARCRAAERARRELDHARRRRDCRRGREPRRHFDRAAKGARARHPRADLGRRRRARRARLLREPGDGRGHRQRR